MYKILLAEDDNNLREIYEARLQAEGYTIVSARDGEEALVVAKAEKPDLIISDIMMPKISGFEMLDILRNTEGLKNVKVVMLTALGQTDDQQRADKLGADRYLVKSQVTLEDIVKAAHDLLGDATPAPAAPAPAPAPSPTPQQVPVAEPPAEPPATTTPTDEPKLAVHEKVIQPIPSQPPKDINALVAEEEAKATGDATPAATEATAVSGQIEDFVAGASSQPTPPAAPVIPPTPAPEDKPKTAGSSDANNVAL